MDRQNLINRLVAHKIQAAGSARAGCVPCFGSANKAVCIPAVERRAVCIPAARPKK